MAKPFFPSKALVAALASELSKSPLFRGDALAEALEWTDRDFALVFEGGREAVINAAWSALGMRLDDRYEEELVDPEGLMMWRSHVALEMAFYTVAGREAAVEDCRLTALAQGILDEDPSDAEG